jgi:NADH-quinone oxidoreductase subunit C
MAAILERLQQRLPPLECTVTQSHGMTVVSLPPPRLYDVVKVLKDEFQFDLFLDVTAIDWLPRQPRFEVVHHFYSTSHFGRIRLKTTVPDADPAVASLVPLYGCAGIMERECHDMYGIGFHGNADMRPILLYEGFVGHPLRKDYPKLREQPLVPYRK